MRVTNASMASTYLSDTQKSLQKIDKLNTQINSGREINRVSDDPYNAIKVMNLKSEINSVEKFNYNCDEIMGWMDTTDTSLERVGLLTSDIKTLLTSISGTYGEDEIRSVKTEVNEKLKEIAEALNSTYAGKYIFGGTNTDEPPVQVVEGADGLVELKLSDTTNSNKLKVEISAGITIDYNLTAHQVSNNGDGFNTLNNIVKALDKSPIDMDEIGELSSEVNDYMLDILDNRSLTGAKTNTVESVKSNNEDNILNMKKIFSSIQDVDLAEKYIELSNAELVYNSSMQVGSKLIQPTILDYLR